MAEVWKTITEKKGYKVSNLGRVKKPSGFILKGKKMFYDGKSIVIKKLARQYFPSKDDTSNGKRWVPLHPSFNIPGFKVSSTGECKNIKTGYIKKVQPNEKGYIEWAFSSQKKQLLAHVVLAVSFNLPKQVNQNTVDHIDKNRINNNIRNLRWATQREQNLNQNPRSKPTVGRAVNQYDMKDKFIKWWISASHAAKHIGRHNSTIIKACTGVQQSAGGFKWKYAEKDDLENEIWKDFEHGFKVSSLGRVKCPRGRFFQAYKEGKYFRLQIKTQKWRRCRLVCTVFHGLPPTNKHTVDHIDKNTENDHVSNLRWATKEEQATNRKTTRPVVQICPKTKKIINEFVSIAAAARQLKLFTSNIGAICRRKKGKGQYCGGFIFRFRGDTADVL
jgi:hypothetical protein